MKPLNKAVDVEHNYQLYLKKTNLSEDKMHPQQKEQLRRTFFAAWGASLLLLRDSIQIMPKQHTLYIINNMQEQVAEFFENDLKKQNDESTKH